MKKWLVLLLLLTTVPAEGMFPLPQTKVPLQTDVKVKSHRTEQEKDKYSNSPVRTAVEKDATQKAILSIEVRNMSPRVIRDIKISYQLYELQFERSTSRRVLVGGGVGSREKLVLATHGQLTINELKTLEKKVVETEPLETSYRATQDLTKLISRTKSSGSKFGGYIVEYFVGGELVKRDASSRRLHEAYLRFIQPTGTSSSLRMNVRE